MTEILRSYKLTVTTNSGGAGNTTTADPILGRLVELAWDKGTFDNGVDPVLTVENGPVTQTIWDEDDVNSSGRRRIRGATHALAAGTALTDFYDMPVIDGNLKLAITGGGNVKTGSVIAYVLENA